jgi:hypothetical protein
MKTIAFNIRFESMGRSLLLGLLLLSMFFADSCLAETEIFTIHNRRAEEILPGKSAAFPGWKSRREYDSG